MEVIHEMSCVCRACGMNIKRNIKAENYQPRWRAKASKKRDECIAPLCNVTRGIIHTSLVTPQQASELLHATIIENIQGQNNIIMPVTLQANSLHVACK